MKIQFPREFNDLPHRTAEWMRAFMVDVVKVLIIVDRRDAGVLDIDHAYNTGLRIGARNELLSRYSNKFQYEEWVQQEAARIYHRTK